MAGEKTICTSSKYSAKEVQRLNQRVTISLKLLSALQTKDHPNTDEKAQELKEARTCVEDKLREEIAEIAGAFGFELGDSIWDQMRAERERQENEVKRAGVKHLGQVALQDTEHVYCTCLPSTGKSDCPVGIRVGNHPLASKVCKTTGELLGGREDVPHPDMVKEQFPLMGEMKDAAFAVLDDKVLQRAAAKDITSERKFKRLKKAVMRTSDWLVERLFDDIKVKSFKKKRRSFF